MGALRRVAAAAALGASLVVGLPAVASAATSYQLVLILDGRAYAIGQPTSLSQCQQAVANAAARGIPGYCAPR